MNNLKLTKIVYFILFIFFSLLISSCDKHNHPEATEKNMEQPIVIPKPIKKILIKNINEAVKLGNKKAIYQALVKSNDENKNKSIKQLMAVDKQLQAAAKESNQLSLLTNQCAQSLIAYQYNNPKFIEIFITDKHGVNVCQTNKTTDYYQADEAWWQKTYSNGKGNNHYGDIEFDDSAQIISFPIYIAIKKNKRVIGVMKLLLDVNAINNKL